MNISNLAFALLSLSTVYKYRKQGFKFNKYCAITFLIIAVVLQVAVNQYFENLTPPPYFTNEIMDSLKSIVVSNSIDELWPTFVGFAILSTYSYIREKFFVW